MSESDSDLALIHAAFRGDDAAFVELYRRREPDVFRFAYAMSQSQALAQDVTQDVFLDLLQHPGGFDAAKGSVRAWLLGCARHAVIDRLRSERRWVGEAPDEPSAPCCGEQTVLETQQSAWLQAAIRTLPAEYREALVLCELEELSYAESAAIIGCPIGTVRSRLYRARALLAAQLAQTEPDEAGRLLKTSEACS